MAKHHYKFLRPKKTATLHQSPSSTGNSTTTFTTTTTTSTTATYGPTVSPLVTVKYLTPAENERSSPTKWSPPKMGKRPLEEKVSKPGKRDSNLNKGSPTKKRRGEEVGMPGFGWRATSSVFRPTRSGYPCEESQVEEENEVEEELELLLRTGEGPVPVRDADQSNSALLQTTTTDTQTLNLVYELLGRIEEQDGVPPQRYQPAYKNLPYQFAQNQEEKRSFSSPAPQYEEGRTASPLLDNCLYPGTPMPEGNDRSLFRYLTGNKGFYNGGFQLMDLERNNPQTTVNPARTLGKLLCPKKLRSNLNHILERYKLYLSQLSAQLISGGGLLKCREIVSNFWQVQVHYEHLYEDSAFCSAVLSAEQTFLNGLIQAFDFQLSASMITREELLDFTRSLPNWLCGTVPIGFSHSFLGNLATLYDEFSKVSLSIPPSRFVGIVLIFFSEGTLLAT